MYTLLKTILLTTFFFSLLFVGLFLFSMSEKGESLLSPYVQEALEKEIHLPVEVKTLDLQFGKIVLNFLVDQKLFFKTETHYTLAGLLFGKVDQILLTGFDAHEKKIPLVDMTLDTIVYSKKEKKVVGNYLIETLELKKLQPYIPRKLNGPLVLKGVFTREKKLNLRGVSTSLGGKIHYTLKDKEISTTLNGVPLINILGVLGYKKSFLGKAFGTGKYHLKQKSGVVDLDVRDFKIHPSPVTDMLKKFLKKDPSRIIFSSTKFHAQIKGKKTAYTLVAKGTRSSFSILNGEVDREKRRQRADFTLVYEKYTLKGEIKGSLKNPEVSIDAETILKDKLGEKWGGKAAKFLQKYSF